MRCLSGMNARIRARRPAAARPECRMGSGMSGNPFLTALYIAPGLRRAEAHGSHRRGRLDRIIDSPGMKALRVAACVVVLLLPACMAHAQPAPAAPTPAPAQQ